MWWGEDSTEMEQREREREEESENRQDMEERENGDRCVRRFQRLICEKDGTRMIREGTITTIATN